MRLRGWRTVSRSRRRGRMTSLSVRTGRVYSTYLIAGCPSRLSYFAVKSGGERRTVRGSIHYPQQLLLFLMSVCLAAREKYGDLVPRVPASLFPVGFIARSIVLKTLLIILLSLSLSLSFPSLIFRLPSRGNAVVKGTPGCVTASSGFRRSPS